MLLGNGFLAPFLLQLLPAVPASKLHLLFNQFLGHWVQLVHFPCEGQSPCTELGYREILLAIRQDYGICKLRQLGALGALGALGQLGELVN